MLFLKCANEVFEEEIKTIMEWDNIPHEDGEDETYFFIWEEAWWGNIKWESENIGVAPDKAFVAIERDNASLEGVMKFILWKNIITILLKKEFKK